MIILQKNREIFTLQNKINILFYYSVHQDSTTQYPTLTRDKT